MIKIKNVPNIITLLRIVLCVPLYIVSPLSPMFAVIYIACGISDILDGFIARKAGASSRFGAVLDSIADFIVVCVILIKLIPIFEIPRGILAWIIFIAVIRLISLAVGYYKYHAFAFLHTYANKATGILLFIFPLAHNIFGTITALIHVICTASTISAVEELAINIISKELDLNVKSIINGKENCMKFLKWLMPLGMISVAAYFTHVFAGQMLWKEYNPITTDISSLTAAGAPDAEFLRIFTTIYGVCFPFFAAGMVIRAFKDYHTITKTGYVIFLLMALASGIGYTLFPLTGDKTEMNFQNIMHIVVTAFVVLTTILSLFFIAIGYLRKEKQKRLGMICLITDVMITVFGVLNPIGMTINLNILGLTERLVIFTLQIFVFLLSFIYTFKIKSLKNKA